MHCIQVLSNLVRLHYLHLRNEHLFYSFLPLKRRGGICFWAYSSPGNNMPTPSPLLAVSIGKESLTVCLQWLEAELKYFLSEMRALRWDKSPLLCKNKTGVQTEQEQNQTKTKSTPFCAGERKASEAGGGPQTGVAELADVVDLCYLLCRGGINPCHCSPSSGPDPMRCADFKESHWGCVKVLNRTARFSLSLQNVLVGDAAAREAEKHAVNPSVSLLFYNT